MVNYAFYRYKDYIFSIGYNERAIVSLDIATSPKESKASAIADHAFAQIVEYFDKKRQVFDFPIALSGTEFQIKVWEALLKIPYGETRTYKDIAIDIGKPNACRAVGGANNKNPILIAVPCHRVIGKDGSLVGFAAGMELKKTLLELEKHNK